MTPRKTVNTCGKLTISFRCHELYLRGRGKVRKIVPWQPNSASQGIGRGGPKGRRNRKLLFLWQDWAMRLREAGPIVRRDPWRAAAALRLLSGRLGCAAAVAVVSVLRWLSARRGLWIRVALPLPALSGCSSASFLRTGGTRSLFAVRCQLPVPGLGRLRGHDWRDVQEHVPERLPLHPLQHRQQAPADLGQKGEGRGGAGARPTRQPSPPT